MVRRIINELTNNDKKMKKLTIRDVAREAGVSVTLVSFVMNAKMGKDGRLDCPVNPVTAARVLDVAKRLGYRRNNAAASLRSGRSHSIAVIVSDIANPFFADICRSLERFADKEGYTAIFTSSEEDPQKLSRLVETMVGYNVEGLIVAPCLGGENALSHATSIGIPTVRSIQTSWVPGMPGSAVTGMPGRGDRTGLTASFLWPIYLTTMT